MLVEHTPDKSTTVTKPDYSHIRVSNQVRRVGRSQWASDVVNPKAKTQAATLREEQREEVVGVPITYFRKLKLEVWKKSVIF